MVARAVSGFEPRQSVASRQGGTCDGWREEVETDDVRDALTEGLLRAALVFRPDRGPQRPKAGGDIEMSMGRGLRLG